MLSNLWSTKKILMMLCWNFRILHSGVISEVSAKKKILLGVSCLKRLGNILVCLKFESNESEKSMWSKNRDSDVFLLTLCLKCLQRMSKIQRFPLRRWPANGLFWTIFLKITNCSPLAYSMKTANWGGFIISILWKMAELSVKIDL